MVVVETGDDGAALRIVLDVATVEIRSDRRDATVGAADVDQAPVDLSPSHDHR